jgi:hypothetical protein
MRVRSSVHDATTLTGASLPLKPHLLRLPQEQQHIFKQ